MAISKGQQAARGDDQAAEGRRQWAADRALRPAMRSPGRPEPSRAVQRAFWRLIAAGNSSEDAATEVVLRGQLTNPAPSLAAALRCYRKAGCRRPQVVRSRPAAVKVARRLSPAEIETLAVSYHSGSTVYELAARFGINRHTVSSHLQARGVQLRRSSPTTDEVETAARLYAQGKSLVQVGLELGYDHSTILRAFKNAGVPTRDSHGRERLRS